MVAVSERPIQRRDPIDVHGIENGMHFFAIHALEKLGTHWMTGTS